MNIKIFDAVNILDRITDGICVLDRDWNFLFLNNAAEKFIERSKENMIGKCVWEEFPVLVELPIFSYYQYAMENQELVNFDFYNPILQQWYDVRAYPSNDGLTVYFFDITERKRNSIRTNEYYQSLFTNNPNAVYSFDLIGRFLEVNKAIEELTGYSEEELLYMTYHTLILEEDLEKTKCYFQEAVKGLPQNYECRIIRKSGRVIHTKVTNIPITVDHEIVGVYGIARDITLEKIAEENIEKSEKLSLVGQLSASIAHEIRNPLTTLKGFLQLLRGENEISPNYIEIMLSEMNRIESITSELLLLAKPQAIEFQHEEFKEILHDVVTLLQSQAFMKNIDIVFNCEEVGAIYCVSNQMKQVFINLIKNAIEAMGEGGVVFVNLRNFDKYHVIIEVIDQGCGIPDELAPNIGMPFYSTKEKGTGLGMLTTYKLVNDHGGEITFKSKVGQGTTFRVKLPRKTILYDFKVT
ncbi:PAS domain S-box protein [Anaerobacillus isosaccharinicus]|uniref:histidine kinase n=1 Tax=Anaerobacillus isosaccharinicus TaxID=1532552 RepID=A0A1S2LQC0_9BACI|nr:PAS domain S-box protein [Anaerobacillus isosaccharinicus]MBA5586332.1 PAS domain S-box protein [Anaerobacillus isosaccharinicus]QOY35418.1 PAS domain S-box protein [Anaerobacillus isosaccharinicus]